MNEDITKHLLSYVDSTKDFVLEQAPLFFHEAVTWGRAKAIFNIIIGPIIIGILLKMSLVFLRKYEKKSIDYVEGGYAVMSVCLGIISGLVLIGYIYDFPQYLMPILAPRLYLFKLLTGAFK